MEFIRTIRCEDDQGNQYQVEEWQEFIDAGHMRDPNARIPGMKELRLSDGSPVNFIDSDTFKIVRTDAIIRRI